MLAYETTLEAILQQQPCLQRCTACCARCGIMFLTSPCNAGRQDLRCPFGCRKYHRQQESNRRSRAYYQTKSGKKKKKDLNGRRSKRSETAETEQPESPAAADEPVQTGEPAAAAQPIERVERAHREEPVLAAPCIEFSVEGVPLEEATLQTSLLMSYLQWTVKLIDGLTLLRQELVEVLRQSMRQHSFAGQPRVNQVIEILHFQPP